MCSCACARLPHPPFRPTPSPKPRLASPQGPGPARSRALVARAGAAARDDAHSPPSSFDFLALKRELELEEEEAVAVEADKGGGAVGEGDGERSAGGTRRRRRRQMARRSALLAKQVISVSSARSLGFVSQLWVHAASWVVALVEVRPSLLSGEAENFLFEDISQVGDVLLVEDESVLENEYNLVGLHSLVCQLYQLEQNLLSTWHRSIFVRGFTFDINSGAMESLELDSFGFSIVPSSLVNTYCLFVDDVLDIVSDTIVVHEDAVSRVQRLTQGILGTQNIHGPGGEIDGYRRSGRRRANSQGGQKLRRKARDPEDEWELPMDY
ncbi:hypothetical protein HU200_017857 [Digitaria exilis]|uniref:Uncharacterized protein n=1 Tax=Digitaria exilis TaxID=1010633 RepID=A0A835F4Y5_9POAL|nr:hypothetical protein HU200_017857 [Digitaria exilis]